MKKFICSVCGKEWYSAGNQFKTCNKCGGKLVEEEFKIIKRKGNRSNYVAP